MTRVERLRRGRIGRGRLWFSAGAALAALIGLLVLALVPRGPTLKLVWSDSFSGAAGALPSRTWSYETGGAGWGNGELECYTNVPGNVSTDGKGRLLITALRQPGHVCVDGRSNDYTSARITTRNSFSVQYGRLEMRAKLPTAAGTWPAFWALGADIGEVGWPRSGEIDVMEAAGKNDRQVLGSVHGPTPSGERWYITRFGRSASDLSAGFHTFAVDWTPKQFTYSIDGKPYGTITRAEAERQGVWVFDHRFYLLLDLAVGGQLPGPPSAATTWPQQFAIDYVRVYRITG